MTFKHPKMHTCRSEKSKFSRGSMPPICIESCCLIPHPNPWCFGFSPWCFWNLETACYCLLWYSNCFNDGPVTVSESWHRICLSCFLWSIKCMILACFVHQDNSQRLTKFLWILKPKCSRLRGKKLKAKRTSPQFHEFYVTITKLPTTLSVFM